MNCHILLKILTLTYRFNSELTDIKIVCHLHCIQNQRKSVAAAQEDMKKLSQDLEATEQLCSSLQQGYQEYCPDIQRQKTEVKQLQTRYTNVVNQLQER